MTYSTRNQNLRSLMTNKEGKKTIARMYMESGLTIKEFAKKHGLAPSTVGDYKKNLELLEKRGIDNFNDSTGRPPIIDKVGEEHIASLLHEKNNDETQTVGKSQRQAYKEFASIVASEATNAKHRKGVGGIAKPPSWHTINRLKRKLECMEVQNQNQQLNS